MGGNVIFSAALQAPIVLAPQPAALIVPGNQPVVGGQASAQPNGAALSLAGAAARMNLGMSPPGAAPLLLGGNNANAYSGLVTPVNPSPGIIVVSGQLPTVTGGSSPGSNLTNGVPFSVAGSGFGLKPASAPTVYDACQGATLGSGGWTNARAFYNINNGDAWTEKPRLPTDLTPNGDTWGATAGAIVNPATPFRSKYICGACMTATQSGYAAASLMFGYSISTFRPPGYLVASWYETYSPNWLFGVPFSGGANDNNFKWIDYTTSLTGPYNNNVYWYMEMQNGTGGPPNGFWGPTALPPTDINDDGGGGTGHNPGSGTGDYIGPAMPTKFYNGINGWVKKEFIMRIAADGTGFIQVYISQPGTSKRWSAYLWNHNNGSGNTDGYAGIGRGFYLGGFRRDFPQAQNRQYWSDIYFDWMPDATHTTGNFALSDASTLANSMCIEYQPYTAWSDSSVTLNCQKGNLPSGNVYLWFMDEVNGNRLIGPYTMN